MTQTYKVQVSMNQAHIVESGFVWKQGDFGFNIEIEVLDFDTTGATPQIIFRKSTGAVEATTITRDGNKFTYAIRGTELDTPGPCVCDLKLKDSTTKRVSTASFKYFVIPDTMDGLEQEASSYSDTIEQIVSGFDGEIENLQAQINDNTDIICTDKNLLIKEFDKWSALTSSADTAIYATNFLYEPGYITGIKVKVNSQSNETGAVYAYTKESSGYALWGKLCDFTGMGEFTVSVNKTIDKQFILAFSCNKLAYKPNVTSDYHSAYVHASTPTATISDASFSSNLSFGVGVLYDRLIDAINQIQTVRIIPDIDVRYPIIWDFENSLLKVRFFAIKPKKRGLSSFFNGTYEISITQGTYKNLFLIYDENTDSLEVINGLNLLPTSLTNKYAVAGIYGNGLKFSLYSINADMVKIIHKRTVEGETFPRYAKRRIYTLPIIENKWFGIDGVFLGDSLTKGENPDDSYNAMEDDNITAIAKEELGLFQAYNYGIGGTMISGSSSNSFINRYSNMFDYSNVKLVGVWGGTNDFYHGVDLGSMADTSDNTKFIPALYNLLEGLLVKYKNTKAQIYVVSPPHLYGSDDGYKEDVIRNGYDLKDLVAAMESVCNYFGIPFCNLYKTIGFTPRIADVKTLYQPDGIHFNIAGSREYSCRRIIDFIKTNL